MNRATSRSRIQINGKLNVCSGPVDFWHVRLAVISAQAVVDLDRSGFARCLVGERDGFEILDPWIVAVTRANPVAPGAAVEGVSGGLAFPHINATGDVAFFPADELLADEAGGFQEIRRDLVKCSRHSSSPIVSG